MRAPCFLALLASAALAACAGDDSNVPTQPDSLAPDVASDGSTPDVGAEDGGALDAGAPDSLATDGGAEDVGAAPCNAPSATSAGLRLEACDGSWLLLRPRARIDGQWLGSDDEECTASGLAVACTVGAAGVVTAELDGSTVSVRFEATAAVTVEALALEGDGHVAGATTWMSNGFQSWSQSGAVAIGPGVDDATLEEALAQRGNLETLREGHELSWWYTFVGGGTDAALVAGALTAARFKSWATVRAADDGISVRLVSGDAGEHVDVGAGASLDGERWYLALGDDLHAQLAAYAAELPSRRPAVAPPADAGWNSWYELWNTVDDEAVRANALIAKEILTPSLPAGAPPMRIVVDDGWQVLWGEWTPNEKFPTGLSGLAADLGEDGFVMGVWLAPLLVDEDSALVADHPDWFVGGASFTHTMHGKMRILDVTHPEAAAHLEAAVAQIVSWGYTLLKIDFLFAGTYEGERHEAVTGMEAYARALAVIRKGAGEDTLLLAVGSPPVSTLEVVDAWRVGGDIALEVLGPSWPLIANQARSVAARWPYCLATLCDADPVLLRTLDKEEVDAGGFVAAFAGGALFLSDDLRVLPPERKGWGTGPVVAAAALAGVPSMPVDLVPEDPPERLSNAVIDTVTKSDSHVVPVRWVLPDGTKGAFNASAEAVVVDGVAVPAHAARVLP